MRRESFDGRGGGKEDEWMRRQWKECVGESQWRGEGDALRIRIGPGDKIPRLRKVAGESEGER